MFDFICCAPDEDGHCAGMTSCSEVPHYTLDEQRCNATALPNSTDPYIAGTGECVNWNQYYTECRPHGPNPFQGAISFDNIGLAWVAIFQVNTLCLFFLPVFPPYKQKKIFVICFLSKKSFLKTASNMNVYIIIKLPL